MKELPLFETLCWKQGKLQNLLQHQARMNKSLLEYYGETTPRIQLTDILIQNKTEFIALDYNSIFRCRIDYSNFQYQLKITPHIKKEYKTFKPIICNNIDYHLKFSDRQYLNLLLQQKGNCDEIIIIKNGYVTDCTIGNLIFRKNNQWFTSTTPLLQGTQRAQLLLDKKISEVTIKQQDLLYFDEIRIINALNTL